MKNFRFSSLELLHFFIGLFNNAQRLPHFFIAYLPAVVIIAGCTYWHIELEIFIATVRRMDSYIIVNPRSTQIRTRKAIIQGSFGTDTTGTLRTFYKYPVTFKQVDEFFQHFRILCKKLIQFLKSHIGEISFKSTDTADIGCQS